MTKTTTSRIVTAGVASLTVVALAAGCSSSKKKSGTKASAAGATNGATLNVKDIKPQALNLALDDGVPKGTKIGLVVTGSGPGNDVFGMASGAYIANFRLNGAKSGNDTVTLLVKDDQNDPASATAAVKDLAAQGVAGIVYASAGDQMMPAVQAAAAAGVPVLVPYSGDGRLVSSGSTTFLTGPSDEQEAAKLVKQAGNLTKVAVLRQAGAYGDEGLADLSKAGLAPVKDVVLDPAKADYKSEVAQVAAAGADGVIVWADGTQAVKAINAINAANLNAQVLFSSRAATPAFGRAQTTLIAPSAHDGLLSAGTWAGPWTPTRTIDAFFEAKKKAVSEGGVIADLANADVRSHDAVVAIAFAAKAAKSNKAADVLTAMRTLKADGLAGTPLDFSKQTAVTDGNVAVLAYSTVDDGSGRYPSVATSGGHWVAVDGTFTVPDSLKGLDNPFGG